MFKLTCQMPSIAGVGTGQSPALKTQFYSHMCVAGGQVLEPLLTGVELGFKPRHGMGCEHLNSMYRCRSFTEFGFDLDLAYKLSLKQIYFIHFRQCQQCLFLAFSCFCLVLCFWGFFYQEISCPTMTTWPGHKT